jgi:hypothetical protein
MNAATRSIALGLATLMLPAVALASSSEEWAKMAKDVELKCSEATADIFRKSQVVVDPTGSTNFGLAIVYGRSKEAKGPAAVICVYDKKTMKVEIGSEMGKELIRVRKPKPEGQDQASGQKQSGATGNADDDEQ